MWNVLHHHNIAIGISPLLPAPLFVMVTEFQGHPFLIILFVSHLFNCCAIAPRIKVVPSSFSFACQAAVGPKQIVEKLAGISA